MIQHRPANFPSDLEISQAADAAPIADVARQAGIDSRHLLPFGEYKAKVLPNILDTLADRPNGKYVVVTAINPTPLGEGKTITTIGLSQGFKALGKPVFTCIRQPSMGPTFGIKGGAAGGGYSQVVPMEEFNLHLTGDIHAVAIAHNLMAAAIDARRLHESRRSAPELFDILVKDGRFTDWQKKRLSKLGIDPEKRAEDFTQAEKRRFAYLDMDDHNVFWRRVVDVSDSSLRNTVTGLGGPLDGLARQNGFDIAVASEIMAILALAADLPDLRQRISRIIFGVSRRGEPLTAEDLGVAGAMTVLLKDALKPNLMQTLAKSPVFVHTGPFANIAHGNSSIIADTIALKLASGGYVITEAGFGAECGLEKFIDIKCRTSGLAPDCIVIVATIRALKMHGGGPEVSPGRSLDAAYQTENRELVKAGLGNLTFHIKNCLKFGVPVVVAVNRFLTDSDSEIDIVKEAAISAGAQGAYVSDAWEKGGDGAIDLARGVASACELKKDFRFLYPLDIPIEQKIRTIARDFYNAEDIDLFPDVIKKIRLIRKFGLEGLPICMAKTHLSISHDPALKGVPKDYLLPIVDIRISAGAGFLYPLCGEMRTMPGLPSRPAFMDVDIDPVTEKIRGLF
ncbi:MAG: formate--tetrahydrofolate ligase [Deltaproteobacteria bacterium]|nr:formate--tetrahydrofolate ligase [Candidatus Zymogenaceae bacterium]